MQMWPRTGNHTHGKYECQVTNLFGTSEVRAQVNLTVAGESVAAYIVTRSPKGFISTKRLDRRAQSPGMDNAAVQAFKRVMGERDARG